MYHVESFFLDFLEMSSICESSLCKLICFSSVHSFSLELQRTFGNVDSG